jgi:DNA topoisomerase-3
MPLPEKIDATVYLGSSPKIPPIKKVVVLNVAEKPSVIKAIIQHLAGKNPKVTNYDSVAKYNPVSEFYYKIRGHPASMICTSVSGHLMNYEFPSTCKSWQTTAYDTLFTVGLNKQVHANEIANNIRKFARRSQLLILWLDCDREGEAIAFDVLDVARQANPGI